MIELVSLCGLRGRLLRTHERGFMEQLGLRMRRAG